MQIIVFFKINSLSFHNQEPILNLDCDILHNKWDQMRKFSHILNQHMQDLLNFACCHTKKIMKQFLLQLMIFNNIKLTGTNSAASAQFLVIVGLCFASVTIWHNIVEEKQNQEEAFNNCNGNTLQSQGLKKTKVVANL